MARYTCKVCGKVYPLRKMGCTDFFGLAVSYDVYFPFCKSCFSGPDAVPTLYSDSDKTFKKLTKKYGEPILVKEVWLV